MLLKGKDVAYLGVLLSLNQLFIILSSVIETNTIILMSLAALMVGVVIVEFREKAGIIFYLASVLLGYILTFDKVEFITYISFLDYIVLLNIILKLKYLINIYPM